MRATGGKGRWWWWRNKANIDRDAVDVGLKLQLPSMIIFDMNTFKSDNEIKVRIIRGVF